jgi:hypothetical protein
MRKFCHDSDLAEYKTGVPAMNDDSVVEVYSAANAIEAYALVNALVSQGIQAKVVGDALAARGKMVECVTSFFTRRLRKGVHFERARISHSCQKNGSYQSVEKRRKCDLFLF